jgi:hypothetical protein
MHSGVKNNANMELCGGMEMGWHFGYLGIMPGRRDTMRNWVSLRCISEIWEKRKLGKFLRPLQK